MQFEPLCLGMSHHTGELPNGVCVTLSFNLYLYQKVNEEKVQKRIMCILQIKKTLRCRGESDVLARWPEILVMLDGIAPEARNT